MAQQVYLSQSQLGKRQVGVQCVGLQRTRLIKQYSDVHLDYLLSMTGKLCCDIMACRHMLEQATTDVLHALLQLDKSKADA